MRALVLILLAGLAVHATGCEEVTRDAGSADDGGDGGDGAVGDGAGGDGASGDAQLGDAQLSDAGSCCSAWRALVAPSFASEPDDFSILGGTWLFDGSAHVSAAVTASPLGNILLSDTAVYGSYELEVTVAAPDETLWDDVALIFGYVDGGDYWFVSLNEMNDDSTSGVFRVSGETATEIVDISRALVPGQDTAVRLVIDQMRYEVHVDSALVAQGTASDLRGGRVGVGTYNNRGSFSNLAVRTCACDEEDPAGPTGVSAAQDGSALRVDWLTATDDVAVVGYEVSRDGTLLTAQPVTKRSYLDQAVTAGQTYSYTVTARDAAGRRSPPSTPASATLQSGPQGVVMRVTFDNHTVGAYSSAQAKADWPSSTYFIGLDRCSIVDGSDAVAGRALEVTFSAGQFGPNAGGAQWITALPGKYDELYLSYWVKLGPSFVPVKGGKLPGLAGGTVPSGCQTVSGTDGWSARMMWQKDWGLIQYMYYMDKQNFCGDTWRYALSGSNVVLQTGVWYQIEHRVVMNAPSAGDSTGVVQGWIDGKLAMERTGLRFRTVNTFGIDHFFFSTFYGGGDASYAPSTDTTIFFDDFIIATEPITH